jgi:hypothetical protein
MNKKGNKTDYFMNLMIEGGLIEVTNNHVNRKAFECIPMHTLYSLFEFILGAL